MITNTGLKFNMTELQVCLIKSGLTNNESGNRSYVQMLVRMLKEFIFLFSLKKRMTKMVSPPLLLH